MQKNKSFGEKEAFWRSSAAQLKNVRSLATTGVLSALGVVLQALVIPIGTVLRIGFSFLATALSGFLFGPLAAGFSAMIIDVLGYFFNATGAYFFGFTLNAFINGFIYGCWLYRRPVQLWRVFAACLCSTTVISFLLNPLWLSLLYGDTFLALVLIRIPKNLITLPLNTAMLYFLLRFTEKNVRLGFLR